MQSRHRVVFAAFLMLLLVGCGQPELDLQEFVDTRVEDEWMLPGQYVDASKFFADGGHYYNNPDYPDLTQLDEPHIIPLLEGIRREFDLQPYAIVLDNPEVAWAVVMRLPEGSGARKALAKYLDDAEADFPGMILQEWGNIWLSLDFLDEQEAAMVREGWGLEE